MNSLYNFDENIKLPTIPNMQKITSTFNCYETSNILQCVCYVVFSSNVLNSLNLSDFFSFATLKKAEKKNCNQLYWNL